MRIACIQNGNYTTARRMLRAGGAETYNGQWHTVRAYERFVLGHDALVVSLDAEPHDLQEGRLELTGIPAPRRPLWMRRRRAEERWAEQVIRRLERFDPSHIVLRCVDVMACRIMRWAADHAVPVAAIIAASFDRGRRACVEFCRLANAPGVLFVANHNRIATETLLTCGLAAEKAVAWDLPHDNTPAQYAPKTRTAGSPLTVLYAGSLQTAKGIGDLVDASVLAREQGTDVRVTVCGDGPLHATLSQHAGVREGWLQVPGRVAQGEVVRRMREADVVAVPSRSSFPEGMPFVIQEALAVRSPLVLSTHPVFTRYFTEGHAVRFFQEAAPPALARVLAELAGDTDGYRRLSQQTAAVWDACQCPTKFTDLLDRLHDAWALGPSHPSIEPVAGLSGREVAAPC